MSNQEIIDILVHHLTQPEVEITTAVEPPVPPGSDLVDPVSPRIQETDEVDDSGYDSDDDEDYTLV